MKLTLHTDYALRTLLYLGARPGKVVPASEISDSYGISSNHLAKVVQTLSRLGLVKTHRGVTGGIEMAKRPGDVRLGDIVMLTEPDMNLLECFDPKTNTCRIIGPCKLRPVLQEASSAFVEVLNRYTLADMLSNADELARKLGISALPEDEGGNAETRE